MLLSGIVMLPIIQAFRQRMVGAKFHLEDHIPIFDLNVVMLSLHCYLFVWKIVQYTSDTFIQTFFSARIKFSDVYPTHDVIKCEWSYQIALKSLSFKDFKKIVHVSLELFLVELLISVYNFGTTKSLNRTIFESRQRNSVPKCK